MNSKTKGFELTKIGTVSFVLQVVLGALLGTVYLALYGPNPLLDIMVLMVTMPLGGLLSVMFSVYGKKVEGVRFVGLVSVAGALPVPMMFYGILKYYLN